MILECFKIFIILNFTFIRKLISNWKVIRDEALQVLKRERNAAFREESEQLREAGDWRQFEIFSRGIV